MSLLSSNILTYTTYTYNQHLQLTYTTYTYNEHLQLIHILHISIFTTYAYIYIYIYTSTYINIYNWYIYHPIKLVISTYAIYTYINRGSRRSRCSPNALSSRRLHPSFPLQLFCMIYFYFYFYFILFYFIFWGVCRGYLFLHLLWNLQRNSIVY